VKFAALATTLHVVLTAGSIVLEKFIVAHLVKKFSTLVEPEGSISCAQQPATGPCADPAESSPHPHSISL
jgi:hypothetical protein